MRGIKGSALLMLALLTLGVLPAQAHRDHLGGTIAELLELDVRPFAIAHHGFGDNMGQDPTRPIENTVPSVRQAFRAGVSVVEVDVQRTRDGRVAVFHDDFLSDFTCINQLSLTELQRRLPFVPSLEAVLLEARTFNEPSGPLSGLVIVELKAAAPLCDPHDTEDEAIVAAVTRVVRQMAMTDQVILNSFSPALLYIAAQHAPEIARDLGIIGLQFLPAPEVEAILGLPVAIIDKRLDLGLQWAEIGPVFRLPGYHSVDEVFATAQSSRLRSSRPICSSSNRRGRRSLIRCIASASRRSGSRQRTRRSGSSCSHWVSTASTPMTSRSALSTRHRSPRCARGSGTTLPSTAICVTSRRQSRGTSAVCNLRERR